MAAADDGATSTLVLAAFTAITALLLLARYSMQLFAARRPKKTVLPFQRGILMSGESILKILEPGTYQIPSKRALLICDIRPKPFEVSASELVCADGTGFYMSLTGEFRVADPSAFVTASTDSNGAFYLEIRQVLRRSVAELDTDTILNEPALLVARIKELLAPRGAQLGLEITQLNALDAVPVFRSRQI